MSVTAVGSVHVPRRALRHAYIREALAIGRIYSRDDDRLERVIGTNNKQVEPSVQLYGWAPNVAKHIDATGFVFFAPLVVRYSSIHTPCTSVQLRRGTVYRLNDFVTHWTVDSAAVVCAFIGPFKFPGVGAHVEALQAGIDALASGSNKAPRVSPGFRVPLKGEVFAWSNDSGVELIALEEAKRAGRIIARCGQCEAFAVTVDEHFPYHSDLSRCVKHLSSDEPVIAVKSEVAALEAA